jgi:hypothetical protein
MNSNKQQTMTNNKQQTAVDLFAEKTFNLIELMKRKWVNQEEFLDGMLKARNEAKEMHKEQIENAYDDAIMKGRQEDGEQYYNETYGDGKQ